MARQLEAHSGCELKKGSPPCHAGVFLLVSYVTDDYNVQENILKAVSKEIPAHALCAIAPVFENDVYELYIHGIEYVCDILRKGITIDGEKVEATPLFSHFTISNVYPFIPNPFLIEMFSEFGTVVTVEHVYACPNSIIFGHVLTAKRRIVFEMPPRDSNFDVPKELSVIVDNMLLNLTIEPYCSACMTDGHAILDCPEMTSVPEDDSAPSPVREKNSENDAAFCPATLTLANNDNLPQKEDGDARNISDAAFSQGSSRSKTDRSENKCGRSSKRKKTIKMIRQIKREAETPPKSEPIKYKRLDENQDNFPSVNVASESAFVQESFESVFVQESSESAFVQESSESFTPKISSVVGLVTSTELEESLFRDKSFVSSDGNSSNSHVRKEDTYINAEEILENIKNVYPLKKKLKQRKTLRRALHTDSSDLNTSTSDSSEANMEVISKFSVKGRRGRPRKYDLEAKTEEA